MFCDLKYDEVNNIVLLQKMFCDLKYYEVNKIVLLTCAISRNVFPHLNFVVGQGQSE